MVGALILAGALARADDPEVPDRVLPVFSYEVPVPRGQLSEPLPAAPDEEFVGQAAWCATRRPILLPSTRWCTAVPENCTVMTQWCSDAPPDPVAGRPEDARDAGSEARSTEVDAAPIPWLAPVLLAVLAVGAAWLVFAAWRDQRGQGDVAPEGAPPEPTPVPDEGSISEVLPMTTEPLEVILLRLRKDALVALARAGLLTLEPGRTDREYVGALDRGRDATDLTVLVRAIELVRYARRPVPGPLADAAVQAGERLSRQERG